jgi:hypothetical protein
MAPVRLKLPLIEDAILAWAKEYHSRTGKWPRATSGLVDGAGCHETWRAVDQALRNSGRGLPRGGSSMRLLLLRRLGIRTVHGEDRLTEEKILAWADAHHAATGRWPRCYSSEVIPVAGIMWVSVHLALKIGHRSLPGGDTLTALLVRHGRHVKVEWRNQRAPASATEP